MRIALNVCKLKKIFNVIRKLSTESSNRASTIYALSSGQGKCGVAVVRISGSAAKYAIEKMTSITNVEPRKAYLRNIKNPRTGEIIDRGLCLWFPGPNSFTGENSVEFQVHGGVAVLSSLMSALSDLQFRPALPGEFTRRAFLNNKLELTEIEGLADLIHAETEQQRKQAFLQAQGNLGTLYNSWKNLLLQCLANIEAYIDFSEEENIEIDILKRTNINLTNFMQKLQNHLADGRRGEILRSGIKTTIIGEPNVGKSSLLNRLVHRNAAIVTSIPGTTRDIVELTVNISGYPVVLADTAGLNKSSNDIVELEGIQRARAQAQISDFIIIVMSAYEFKKSNKPLKDYVDTYVKSLDIQDLSKNYILVVNKIDLLDSQMKENLNNSEIVGISCTKNEGFENFLSKMASKFTLICGNPSSENPTISQERHRNHVHNCLDCISQYFAMISEENYDMVLAAQQIREASRELGKITGQISSEDILDAIFKNFCVGK